MMVATEAQIGVVAFLEECAQQRAGVVAPPDLDEVARLSRMLQAEAAGRELIAALIRPEPYPDMSPGAVLRRLLGYLQTVLIASTPDEQIAPLLSVRIHHVNLVADLARLLRDAALVLVLAAWDGGAHNIDVLLTDGLEGAHLTVESDQPGSIADLVALHPLRESIRACGGTWEGQHPAHGGSWQVQVVLPRSRIVTSEYGGGL